jgi:hypothetical protein
MEVDHVVSKTKQQSQDSNAAPWVVDVIAIGALMASEVNDRAGVATSPEEIAQCDEIGLHAAPRRRVRAKKQDPQW